MFGLVVTAVAAIAHAQEPPPNAVRVGSVTITPRRTRHVPPAYPREVQLAGVDGTVFVEATIGVDGRVTNARVLRSVPFLDDPALEAVRQWEYSPTVLHDAPVPVIMTVTVTFSLRRPPDAPLFPPLITTPWASAAGAARVGGDIKAPRQVRMVPAAYPDGAQPDALSRVAVMEVLIGPDGTVKDARLLRASPFEAAALAAVRQWEFEPTMVGGTPVTAAMPVIVPFRTAAR